ncbi:MAG: hypothetical protein V4619_05340 [Bacteroidota bacterium]
MKKIKVNGALIVMCAFITLAISSLSFTTRYGLDGYEVYLNDKLVLKQSVNQPLNLRILNLDKAKETDQLQFLYKHCMRDNGPGTGRSIALKDDTGNTLRKWDFADADKGGLRMAIAVKDLLLLQKKSAGHQLSLFYSSRELGKGEMLSMVRF